MTLWLTIGDHWRRAADLGRYMRSSLPSLLLATMLICIVPGCVQQRGQGGRPAAFDEAAKQFKGKDGANRLGEGRKVASLLPKCPATMAHGTGTGVLEAHDYSRPSYRMVREDLLDALGQPIRSKAEPGSYELVDYELLIDGQMHWYLEIECRNGYVVESTVRGELENK